MKDIKGYEGLYAVTSCGRVWSYKNKKFLSPRVRKDGYLDINLYKGGEKKIFLVHQLIAETYIPNPENKPTVNHLDEIKNHNYVNNLTWSTMAEQNAHGTRLQRFAESRKRAVYCIELDKVFPSAKEAAEEFKINKTGISNCLHGRQKTAGGYHWQFAS